MERDVASVDLLTDFDCAQVSWERIQIPTEAYIKKLFEAYIQHDIPVSLCDILGTGQNNEPLYSKLCQPHHDILPPKPSFFYLQNVLTSMRLIASTSKKICVCAILRVETLLALVSSCCDGWDVWRDRCFGVHVTMRNFAQTVGESTIFIIVTQPSRSISVISLVHFANLSISIDSCFTIQASLISSS